MSEMLPPELATQVTRPTVRLFQSRWGLWLVGLISFIEGALLVPIITDPFMIAYILLNRAKAFRAVVVTTLTSVAGGIAAYFMAFFFSELIIHFLSPNSASQLTQLATEVRSGTFVLTILGAITPVPYTLVCLAVGFVKGNLWVFIGASLLGRGSRYVVVGFLTYTFGTQAMQHIKKQLRSVTLVTIFLIVVYIWYTLSVG